MVKHIFLAKIGPLFALNHPDQMGKILIFFWLTHFYRSFYVNNGGDADILFEEIVFLKSVCGALL